MHAEVESQVCCVILPSLPIAEKCLRTIMSCFGQLLCSVFVYELKKKQLKLAGLQQCHGVEQAHVSFNARN